MNLPRTRSPHVLFVFAFVGGLLLAWPGGEARSDPLVVVRAMTATTIAEAYLDRDSLTLELEIGVRDLLAFRNLMPDRIYDRLGQPPEAADARLRRFFRDDLRVTFDGRGATGELRELTARPRIERDEVTGEPLPVQPEGGELTVFVRLVYDVPDRPTTIALSPPTDPNDLPANIGFVPSHAPLSSPFRHCLRLASPSSQFARCRRRCSATNSSTITSSGRASSPRTRSEIRCGFTTVNRKPAFPEFDAFCC